ncbi:hypothetical protein HYH02_002321 [Chlamydomonas schloesseri]|uniref:Uncharacterized protein n=1 Tax=Chlamydomonas schloesseri TaxID=2026947 RepID=A0A835WRT8_9CHLO|nr:hypothetical protein HYH02_002321 [Chlamydomonas schloesseri]|eukprot:KAG2452984.1 hypothetical protein HYH02_002321 [Chlamydomonas schloesseri]
MQRAVQSFARLARAHPPMTRAFALEGTKFSEGEKAIEDLFFSKEDQRLMAKLLQKVKEQSDLADKHAAEGVKAAELSSLKQIVGKYELPKDVLEKLIKWKHTHY